MPLKHNKRLMMMFCWYLLCHLNHVWYEQIMQHKKKHTPYINFHCNFLKFYILQSPFQICTFKNFVKCKYSLANNNVCFVCLARPHHACQAEIYFIWKRDYPSMFALVLLLVNWVAYCLSTWSLCAGNCLSPFAQSIQFGYLSFSKSLALTFSFSSFFFS